MRVYPFPTLLWITHPVLQSKSSTRLEFRSLCSQHVSEHFFLVIFNDFLYFCEIETDFQQVLTTWTDLKQFRRRMWALLGAPGHSWGTLGNPVGLSWDSWKPLGRLLVASWTQLEKVSRNGLHSEAKIHPSWLQNLKKNQRQKTN